jgi:hypothetical protein
MFGLDLEPVEFVGGSSGFLPQGACVVSVEARVSLFASGVSCSQRPPQNRVGSVALGYFPQ